jgi:hypothetical protein
MQNHTVIALRATRDARIWLCILRRLPRDSRATRRIAFLYANYTVNFVHETRAVACLLRQDYLRTDNFSVSKAQMQETTGRMEVL